jgi:RNA polymerase sigma factor (sigma-70 family)
MGADRQTDATQGERVATIRTSRAAGVLARLLTEASTDVEQTDGELVRAFVERKCPAAFGELVLRHGPMVLGVCLRVLRHRQDAEDAFQATFLVLARKAGSVSPRDAVGNWLHGVALQTAIRARAITMKRRRREAVVPSVPETAAREAGWDDVAEVLDEELGRLPSHYRAVLLLCDVEGRTRAAAARHLGCPEGSVSSRLSRARAMLAKRLTRRGVTLPAGAVALLVSRNATRAGVPAALMTSTVEAVGSLAAGSVLGSGVSLEVTTLTDGVLKAMFIKKIIPTTMVVLALSVAAITGGSLALGQTEGTDKPMAGKDVKQPAAEKPVEPPAKQEKEAFTVWGKEINGLQAGLGFRPGEKRAYTHGETVTLVVRVRNVGKAEVKFQYVPAFLKENPPAVTDGEGKPVPLRGIAVSGKIHPAADVTLAPGKEIELYEWKRELQSAKWLGNDEIPRLFGTGTFHIQYERVFGNSTASFIEIDPALSKLATGKLELEVKDAPAEKQKVLTPEEAIKVASDSKLATAFNENKPAVEFKVQFVTKAILVKAAGDKKDAGWDHGHSPDDVCLGTLVPSSPIKGEDPLGRKHTRFVATLTAKAVTQLNKAGVNDFEKHFKGTTVRVTGPISRSDYDGWGTPPEVEIVIDDLSQLEVVK